MERSVFKTRHCLDTLLRIRHFLISPNHRSIRVISLIQSRIMMFPQHTNMAPRALLLIARPHLTTIVKVLLTTLVHIITRIQIRLQDYRILNRFGHRVMKVERLQVGDLV